MSYGISNFLITDNGLRLVNNFHNDLSGFLDVNQVTITAYHQQKNCKTDSKRKIGRAIG